MAFTMQFYFYFESFFFPLSFMKVSEGCHCWHTEVLPVQQKAQWTCSM